MVPENLVPRLCAFRPGRRARGSPDQPTELARNRTNHPRWMPVDIRSRIEYAVATHPYAQLSADRPVQDGVIFRVGRVF